MALEYIEIRDINRELIGIIDTAKSVIWHEVYFGVGDFEIYAKATPEHLFLLRAGKDSTDAENFRYVTRPDEFNDTIGIIEKVNIVDDLQNGRMIIATGQFAKSILGRRLIYKLSGKTNTPTTLKGNVEDNIRRVVRDNAINCTFDSRRNIGELELGSSSHTEEIIVDADGNPAEKQASYENLLEYTDGVLQEYGLAGVVYLDLDNNAKKLKYRVEKGIDRSADNTWGLEPIVFSKEYDNLSASEYLYDTSTEKNTALIGGEGEGKDRFYSLVAPNKTGLARRELWVDAQSINKTLKATELQELFPTGTFSGINFVVGGVTYAVLVVDLEQEYTLTTLQDKFPSNSVSGTKFKVNGVAYAVKVYSDDPKYDLTAEGYKAKFASRIKQSGYTVADLQSMFPTGTISGNNYIVNGTVYATKHDDDAKYDLTAAGYKDYLSRYDNIDGYTLTDLQETFSNGKISGDKFYVSGKNYANKIRGEEPKYKLTPLGYKAMLDADEREGNYTLSDAVYKTMLNTKGKQTLAPLVATEIFNGTINVSAGNYILNRDFWLGDIVTVQENSLGLYINVRITETTEIQDENGYAVEVKYE